MTIECSVLAWLVLLSLPVFVVTIVYISNRLFYLLNGHLERLQVKLDVLQVQQQETNELLENLIRRLL